MINRKSYLQKIESGFKTVPVVLLIGARQVGKTSIMKLFCEGKGHLFLNGQNPEIAELFQKYSLIESYLKIYLDKNVEGLLVIDEFQYIDGISTMLKLLTDENQGLKILCSGSSSLNMHQKVEESLAGRVRIIEVLSLSFTEYIDFKDEKLAEFFRNFDTNTESSAFTNPFEAILYEYLLYGGLPRAALSGEVNGKLEVLEDIYKTYLLKDVREFVKNEHFVGFNKLLRLLALQTGNLVNVNELSRESGLPYKKCEEYIAILEQMYIIKLIEPFFSNKRKAMAKMKKVFFCDLGLRNIIAGNFSHITYRSDNGSLFENYVFLELLRNRTPGHNISFYRTLDGAKIDFIVEKPNTILAVECKFRKFDKPSSIRVLKGFSDIEKNVVKFIVNLSLNLEFENQKYIQGFLVNYIQ